MVTLGEWRLSLAFEQMLLPGDVGELGRSLVLRKRRMQDPHTGIANGRGENLGCGNRDNLASAQDNRLGRNILVRAAVAINQRLP